MFKTSVTRRQWKKSARRKTPRVVQDGGRVPTTTPPSQWYAVTNDVTSQAAAQALCQTFGGTLATSAQITDAHSNGASRQQWGWIADSATWQGFPVRNQSFNNSWIQHGTVTPNAMANCYGPKPPAGTPNVAPWTDVAQPHPGTSPIPNNITYTAGEWSRKIISSTGVVQWYPAATNGVASQAEAHAVCQSFGGSLATYSQIKKAYDDGASNSGWGWIEDSPTAQAAPGKWAPVVGDIYFMKYTDSIANPNGYANCYGPKPPSGTANVGPWNNVLTVSATIIPSKQVYGIGLSLSPNSNDQAKTQAVAQAICTKLNATLATTAQVTDAVANGFRGMNTYWISDNPTQILSLSMQGGITFMAPPTQGGIAACYGLKPAFNNQGLPGSPTVSAAGITRNIDLPNRWNSSNNSITANNIRFDPNDYYQIVTTPASIVYQPDTWSQINAALPIRDTHEFAETYYVPGEFTKQQAIVACAANSAVLATSAQLKLAQGLGAQWNTPGWVSDGNPQYPLQIPPGINQSTRTSVGANCYGQKPLPNVFTLPTGNLIQTIQINRPGRFVRVKASLIGDGWMHFNQIIVKDTSGNIISQGQPCVSTSMNNNAANPSGLPGVAVNGIYGTMSGTHIYASNTTLPCLGSVVVGGTIVYYIKNGIHLKMVDEYNNAKYVEFTANPTTSDVIARWPGATNSGPGTYVFNPTAANWITGQTNPIFHIGRAMGSTDLEYWQVDLGSVKNIGSVTYIGRGDHDPGRTLGLRIIILQNQTEFYLPTNDLTQTLTINAYARYIRVRASIYTSNSSGSLGVSQVVVKGQNGNNISNNPATVVTATSTYGGSIGAAAMVTSASPSPQGWNNIWTPEKSVTPYVDNEHLQIDLGSIKYIETIDYYARSDPCCSNGAAPNDWITGTRISILGIPEEQQAEAFTRVYNTPPNNTVYAWSNVQNGYVGIANIWTSYGSGSFKSFNEAQNMCEAVADCGGITFWPGDNTYTLRAGSTISPSGLAEKSWLKSVAPPGRVKEVFATTNGGIGSQDAAAATCNNMGAQLATTAQLTDAWNNGASWFTSAWVADQTTKLFPTNNHSYVPNYNSAFKDNAINSVTSSTGDATCYGVKPASGLQPFNDPLRIWNTLQSTTFLLPTTNVVQKITVNIPGRYVRVRPSLTTGGINISQLIVTNTAGKVISQGQPVYVTSTISAGGVSAAAGSTIVDGVNPLIPRTWPRIWAAARNVSLTDSNGLNADTEFLQVDLGSQQNIGTITFVGRYDCCPPDLGTRIQILQGAAVSATPTPPVSSVTQPNQFTLQSSDIDQTILTSGLVGRYVRIQPAVNSKDQYITLSQIAVYNTNGENVALNRPVFATDTSTNTNASFLTDGRMVPRPGGVDLYQGSGIKNYLEIDLGVPTSIASIRIINTNDSYILPNSYSNSIFPWRILGTRVEVSLQGACPAYDYNTPLQLSYYKTGATSYAGNNVCTPPTPPILSGLNSLLPGINTEYNRQAPTSTINFAPTVQFTLKGTGSWGTIPINTTGLVAGNTYILSVRVRQVNSIPATNNISSNMKLRWTNDIDNSTNVYTPLNPTRNDFGLYHTITLVPQTFSFIVACTTERLISTPQLYLQTFKTSSQHATDSVQLEFSSISLRQFSTPSTPSVIATPELLMPLSALYGGISTKLVRPQPNAATTQVTLEGNNSWATIGLNVQTLIAGSTYRLTFMARQVAAITGTNNILTKIILRNTNANDNDSSKFYNPIQVSGGATVNGAGTSDVNMDVTTTAKLCSFTFTYTAPSIPQTSQLFIQTFKTGSNSANDVVTLEFSAINIVALCPAGQYMTANGICNLCASGYYSSAGDAVCRPSNGRNEVYRVGPAVRLNAAAAVCTAQGAQLATLQQVINAGMDGAAWDNSAWIQEDTTAIGNTGHGANYAIPTVYGTAEYNAGINLAVSNPPISYIISGISALVRSAYYGDSPTTLAPVACYGVKPASGTANIGAFSSQGARPWGNPYTCPVGTVFRPGYNACALCGPGYTGGVASFGQNANCTLCPANSYCDGTYSNPVNVMACPPLYTSPAGSAACVMTAATIANILSDRQFWSPKINPGIQIWLDGADPAGNGVKPAVGAPLTTWVDKSGLGNNATVNSPANVPTFTSSGISFTRLNYYNLPDRSIPFGDSSYTFFYIANVAEAGDKGIFGAGGGDNNQVLCSRVHPNRQIYTFWWNNDILSPGTITPGTPFLYSSTYQTRGTRQAWISGYSNGGNDIPPPRTQPFTGNRIGIDRGNVTLDGTISEFIMFNSTLSDVQRQFVEGYLALKWGIQNQLPPTHPFSASQQLAVPSTLSANQMLSPRNIPSIQLWFDGADPAGNGVRPANGAAITTWVDKSGLGKNATVNFATNVPTFMNNGMLFNASNFYNLPDGSIPSDDTSYTFFYIARFANPSAGSGVFCGGTPGFGQMLASRQDRTNVYTYWYVYDILSTGTFTAGAPLLYSSTYQSRGVRQAWMSGYANGGNDTPANPRAQGKTGNRLGSSAGTEYMDGTIHEFIMFNTRLSDIERQFVEGYLAWKWGLQGNLPIEHPFAVGEQQKASLAVAQTASSAQQQVASSAQIQQASSALAQTASSALAQTASSALAQTASSALAQMASSALAQTASSALAQTASSALAQQASSAQQQAASSALAQTASSALAQQASSALAQTASSALAQQASSAQQQAASSAQQQAASSAQQQAASSALAQQASSAQQQTASSALAQQASSAQQQTASSALAQQASSAQQQAASSAQQQAASSAQQQAASSALAQQASSAQQQTASSALAQQASSAQQQAASSALAQQASSAQQQAASSALAQQASSAQQQAASSALAQRASSAQQQFASSAQQQAASSALAQQASSAQQQFASSAQQQAASSALAQNASSSLAQQASSAVAQNASSALAQQASSALAQNASSAVAQNASSAVAQQASSALAQNASSAVAQNASSAVAQQASSAVAQNASSALAQQASSAVAQQASSALAQKASSAVAQQASSALAQQASSAVGQQASSAVAQNASSALAQQASSALAQQASSAVAQQASSAVAQNASSAVAQNASSAVAQQASSAVAQNASSAVAQQASSAVAQNASSAVAQQASSAVGQQASSAVAQNASSAMAQQASSAVAQQASSAVAQNASSAVAQQASSAVAQQASSALAQQASSALNKQASSAVAQQASSALVQQASSAIAQKASSAVVQQRMASSAIAQTVSSAQEQKASAALSVLAAAISTFSLYENNIYYNYGDIVVATDNNVYTYISYDSNNGIPLTDSDSWQLIGDAVTVRNNLDEQQAQSIQNAINSFTPYNSSVYYNYGDMVIDTDNKVYSYNSFDTVVGSTPSTSPEVWTLLGDPLTVINTYIIN